MSKVWWGQETDKAVIKPSAQDWRLVPNDGRSNIYAEVFERIPSYTPEWRTGQSKDAGSALLLLHAEIAEPVVDRINRLPEKLQLEFFRALGISPTLAKPARALLEFSASPAAPSSVYLAQGFQVSAPADSDSVIFETESDLFVLPGKIEMSFVQEGNSFYEIDVNDAFESAVAIFGSKPTSKSALLLGINSKISPNTSLSLGVQVARQDGAPPVVARGGIDSLLPDVSALLRWELLDGGSFIDLEIIKDETRGLTQSGIIELRMPKQWRVGTPSGIEADQELRWLRIRLMHGQFANPPLVNFIRLNMVYAQAQQTIHDEVLQYVPGKKGREMSISQPPVMPGSLKLRVDEGQIVSFATVATSPLDDGSMFWQEVTQLKDYGPDDRVYELDAVNGIVRFGDGVNGTQLPQGIRHVLANYIQASGKQGSVDANTITDLVSSVNYLSAVTNPVKASGGRDEESLASTLITGPEKIRSRNRAVTSADYALLALHAPGADISRAHAIASHHAGYQGAVVPGVVSVYLLGFDTDLGPPYPDQESMKAVTKYLTDQLAPTGIEVVAAAPQFHHLSIRASIIIGKDADDGEAVRQTLRAIDQYLDPLTGGDNGQGWPFGGKLYYDSLIRFVLASVTMLSAISTLNFVVDQKNLPECENFQPQLHGLFWPSRHEIRILNEDES